MVCIKTLWQKCKCRNRESFPTWHFHQFRNRRVTRCLRQENIVPLAILRQAIYEATATNISVASLSLSHPEKVL